MRKAVIRLTESDLHNIVKYVINESLNTIRLQFVNGYFYPTDAVSRNILSDELHLGRIPEDRLDIISPRLVKNGYRLAISDYDIPRTDYREPTEPRWKVGGEPKPQKDPCPKCKLKDVCDSDDCGKKNFRLFSNKKPKFN